MNSATELQTIRAIRVIGNDNATAIRIGETREFGAWRAQLYRGSLRCTHLVGAGKRGKRCAVISVYGCYAPDELDWLCYEVAPALARAMAAGASPLELLQMAELFRAAPCGHKECAESDAFRLACDARKLSCLISSDEERGVDVRPSDATAPVITIEGDRCVLTVSPTEFVLNDHADQNNLPAVISTSRHKSEAAKLYKRVRANPAAFAGLDFNATWRLMGCGHYYCRMD